MPYREDTHLGRSHIGEKWAKYTAHSCTVRDSGFGVDRKKWKEVAAFLMSVRIPSFHLSVCFWMVVVEGVKARGKEIRRTTAVPPRFPLMRVTFPLRATLPRLFFCCCTSYSAVANPQQSKFGSSSCPDSDPFILFVRRGCRFRLCSSCPVLGTSRRLLFLYSMCSGKGKY